MRITITADPYVPVPPRLYGGIERIIGLLARRLADRGHTVHLIAHPDSAIDNVVTIPYGKPPHSGTIARFQELRQLQTAIVRRVGSVDVVHSFGRLAGLLPILPVRRIPKIQSYQRAISWPGITRAVRLAGSSLHFTACSSAVYRDRFKHGPHAGVWHTIYNGIEVERYDCTPSVASDAPLVFLGKLEPMKGVHVAIEVAKASGRRLVIAGNRVTDGPDASYFDREIAPHIDGRLVEYIGEVDDRQKNVLLGRAAALLFPTFYEEAFGIVMIEAMACGTPVVASPRGSVPEVVRDGVNGYICRSTADAAAAVARLDRLDRRAVRRDCESRFSAGLIVGDYERLYSDMIARVCRAA
jgi:glycosyltransferase involved in cell wall biosynthesis